MSAAAEIRVKMSREEHIRHVAASEQEKNDKVDMKESASKAMLTQQGVIHHTTHNIVKSDIVQAPHRIVSSVRTQESMPHKRTTIHSKRPVMHGYNQGYGYNNMVPTWIGPDCIDRTRKSTQLLLEGFQHTLYVLGLMLAVLLGLIIGMWIHSLLRMSRDDTCKCDDHDHDHERVQRR